MLELLRSVVSHLRVRKDTKEEGNVPDLYRAVGCAEPTLYARIEDFRMDARLLP